MPSSTNCASQTRGCPVDENCRCSSTLAPQVAEFPSLFSLLIVQLSCSCSAWWFYACNTTLKSVCSATAEVVRLIQYASLLFCWITLRSPYDSALNKNSPFILCRAVDPASAELNPHSSSRSLSHSCFCTRWETLIVILLTLSIAGFSASWEEKKLKYIFIFYLFDFMFFKSRYWRIKTLKIVFIFLKTIFIFHGNILISTPYLSPILDVPINIVYLYKFEHLCYF